MTFSVGEPTVLAMFQRNLVAQPVELAACEDKIQHQMMRQKESLQCEGCVYKHHLKRRNACGDMHCCPISKQQQEQQCLAVSKILQVCPIRHNKNNRFAARFG
jgi:hypothetical protein